MKIIIQRLNRFVTGWKGRGAQNIVLLQVLWLEFSPRQGLLCLPGIGPGKLSQKKTTQSLRVVWKGLQWNCGSPGVIPECNFEAAQRISSFM